jgi:hypothetical protein
MRLLAMMPSVSPRDLSARDVDATTYRCEVCNIESDYRTLELAA